MVMISFASKKQETKGLDFLLGRFSFHTRRDGVTLVPEPAWIAMAREGLPFRVEGAATYEEIVSTFRNASAASVQRRPPRASGNKHGQLRANGLMGDGCIGIK